ncbi:MAG: hypothetical protein JW723_06475 [Bacteroidales bacterium]|nr:hypothetical protein [Bacteroidales bacterium]
MSFKDQLVDSSKMIGNMVARNVGNDPSSYKEILDLVLYEPMPVSSRAGRVLDLCTEKEPSLFQSHVSVVINEIKRKKKVHRCILKIFAGQQIVLSEHQEGILVNACFEWLADESQSIATKVYCMEILAGFAEKEAGIIPELIALLEELLPGASTGTRNRALKIIKRFK